MSARNRNILHLVLAALLVGLDQITKVWARSYLRDTLHLDDPSNPDAPMSLVGGWLKIYYIENTGAFLGLGDDWPNWLHLALFSILPLVFLTVFYVMVLRKSGKYTNLQFTAFTLFVAGGIGNIIDRIVFERRVTDFMMVGIPDSWHTGIFNVADMYVTAAAIILVVMAIFTKKKPSAEGDAGTTES